MAELVRCIFAIKVEFIGIILVVFVSNVRVFSGDSSGTVLYPLVVRPCLPNLAVLSE